jgi:REP element-mobilizing transposase RayT
MDRNHIKRRSKTMPTGYQIQNQSQAYYLTLQVVYWIDVFTRKECRDVVIDSLRYCQEHKGLEIFAYVIMSNHVHLLARSSVGDLSGTLRDFKKHTSKQLVEFIANGVESRKEWMLRLFAHAAKRQNKQGKYQLWTHENHAKETFSNHFLTSTVNYIHQNPVRAGWVERAEDYLYSSARSYAGLDGMLNVLLVDRQWKTYT